VPVKIQYSVETAILFAFSLLLLVGLIYYFAVANNSNLQYEATPFVLSSLEFYNFQTMGSTCSFDFAFQTNSYLPYPKYELSFILNNGQKIVPDYNAYSESVTPVLSSGYQYTFTLIGVPNYNGSVCSVMGQQSVNHAYVKYISYKNANGKTIVQPVSTNYVFKINSASTIPVQLYNNNTVFITGSVIPYSGYVYISYQNKTSVPGSPFTLGEYVYLPTGNYTLSYTNESNPVAFQYWSGNGGVIIQNMFNTTTNMTVINNGEIYLSLRNLLKPSATFIIYSNKTYSRTPGKFNITANFTKNGYYTYYVNNQPYNGCINVNKTSCVMSFSVAGDYIISATFKNSTVFAEATPIEVYVFNPLSATLSSNETVAQNKTNVLLSVATYNGLKPFTYSFYVNNAPIQNYIDISTPTCTYNIDNLPNDYVYNYTFIANVSDAGGELVTTNNVIVEGVVPIYVAQFNGQNAYAYGSLTNYFGGNNQLTAIAWADITSNGNGPIFGVTNSPPGGNWNMPFLSEDGLTVYGWLWGVNGNNPIGYTVSSSGWYMLAITYNPSGSGIEDFYVNGQLVGSASGQYSSSGSTDYWTTYISGAKPSGVNDYYNSLIGDVQAYSTALTQSQIQTLYKEGIDGPPIGNAGLISWWKLENNVNDSSGNGNNGVSSNLAYKQITILHN